MMQRGFRAWSAVVVTIALMAAACGGGEGTDDGAAVADDTAVGDTGADAPDAADDESDAADDGSDDGVDPATDGGTPVHGGMATYGIISDGTGFSTTDAVQEGAIRIIGALNDSLVAIDENGEWAPLLAESLTPNDDATVWTIGLRDGVTFHDGVPVDAAAVQANLDAFRASPTVGFSLSVVESIEVVDPLTVQVNMRSPWAAFPHTLIGQPGWMVSPETIGLNDMFVGTGPFVLESWTPGDGAITVRNDDYWAAGDDDLPYLDGVNFKVIPDQSARRQALEAGDIDAYYAPGDLDIIDFMATDDIQIIVDSGASNEILYILNTTTAPTDDVRIRRAMAHAIDQELIISQFRSDLTEPASSFIDPSSKWWADTEYPQYDPEEAQALVAAYEAEVGPAELTLFASNIDSVLEVSEVIVSFWEDAGIDVTLEIIQPGNEVPPVIGDAFQAIFWAQFGAVDPDGSYVFFHSSGGLLNWSNLVDPRMDEGFDLGRESFDEAERARGYAMVQEVFADQVPMIWIDHLSGVEGVAAQPDLNNILGGTLPDGRPRWGFLSGSYFSWDDIWIG
ncbi:MAG: ABC transporter substrate-binding protein [Acidimicrobiia bacterium]|nr:ABC transporter substrate-binding protein [Acidimicrobiia bacterium]